MGLFRKAPCPAFGRRGGRYKHPGRIIGCGHAITKEDGHANPKLAKKNI